MANHDLMRTTNTLEILKCVRDAGPLTKREIQARVGLSWGAVSNITGDLLRRGLLAECKRKETSVGRTPSIYEINGQRNLCIGLDINAEGITGVLTDLKCRSIKETRLNNLENTRAGILDQVGQVIQTLSADLAGRLIGIGVAMQGSVDAEHGVSVFSPYFPDWHNVPIKKLLEDEFGIQTRVEHDPNCMALAEQWLGVAREVKNVLFVRMTMGIGLSIMIDGRIYRGADGNAGEFGHIIMNPGGLRCTCGNYGCLEAYASGRSILARAMEGIRLGRCGGIEPPADGTELKLETIADAARQGHAYLAGLFEEAGSYLGIGLSSLVNILNPELIVIGGGLARFADLFLERAKAAAMDKVWKGCRVNLVLSSLPNNAAAIGAAGMIAQDVFAGSYPSLVG